MNIHGTLFKPPTDSGAYHHHHHRRHRCRMIYINIFIYETTASGRGKTRTTSGKNYTFYSRVQCVPRLENDTESFTRNVSIRVLILNGNRFYILGNFKNFILNTAEHGHAADWCGRSDDRITRIPTVKKHASRRQTCFRSCVAFEKSR